jgi:hypothetical protein
MHHELKGMEMAQDPRTIVHTTTRLFSEEVARANAVDASETANTPFPIDKGEPGYEFTGRTFKAGLGPYAT